jgi:hypothetical protein
MEFSLIEETTTTTVSFKTGNSILHFRLTTKAVSPFYHIAFSIPNNKFQDALDWISKRNSYSALFRKRIDSRLYWLECKGILFSGQPAKYFGVH